MVGPDFMFPAVGNLFILLVGGLQRTLVAVPNGGLENPAIADYDISVRSAYRLIIDCEGHRRNVTIPNNNQHNRYLNIRRPWKFIEENLGVK